MTETAGAPPASRSDVATQNAARHMVQLCKHFRHKCPETEWSQTTARIVFPTGECRLAAGDAFLTMTLTAPDAETLATLEDVVARHLVRFAFREDLLVAWQRGAQAAAA